MSLIKKYDSDFLLDQACLKALDDKGLLNKKPIRIGHQVVDRSTLPTPRSEGSTKVTRRKKLNFIVKRRDENE